MGAIHRHTHTVDHMLNTKKPHCKLFSHFIWTIYVSTVNKRRNRCVIMMSGIHTICVTSLEMKAI